MGMGCGLTVKSRGTTDVVVIIKCAVKYFFINNLNLNVYVCIYVCI